MCALLLFQMFQKFWAQLRSPFLSRAPTMCVWAGVHCSLVGSDSTRLSMRCYPLEQFGRSPSGIMRTPPCWLNFDQLRNTWSRSPPCTTQARRGRCLSKPALKRVSKDPKSLRTSDPSQSHWMIYIWVFKWFGQTRWMHWWGKSSFLMSYWKENNIRMLSKKISLVGSSLALSSHKFHFSHFGLKVIHEDLCVRALSYRHRTTKVIYSVCAVLCFKEHARWERQVCTSGLSKCIHITSDEWSHLLQGCW